MRSESELRRLTGIKWSRHPEDVLPAWVADMDISPPEFVIDAVTTIAERGDFGYNLEASAQLPEVFQAWQSRYHGWEPDLDGLMLFNDVLHAIDVSLWLHTKPGDGIILLTPIYPPFLRAVEGSGRRLVDVPLDPDGWRLDPERLAAAVDDTTTAILLCSPHNPTGRVFDRAEREAIAKVVVENDLLLVSDEVWGDLTHPGATHVPMASVDEELAARTVTISSASKGFNLAGLRCALAHVGSPRLAAKLDELPSHFLGAVSTTGAEAALACWTQGHDWLAQTRHFLTDRRQQLVDRVASDLPMVTYQPGEATYLAWLDFNQTGIGPDAAGWILDHAKVALSSGLDFGVHGTGFARLNTATSPELLDEIVDRIVVAVKDQAPART